MKTVGAIGSLFLMPKGGFSQSILPPKSNWAIHDGYITKSLSTLVRRNRSGSSLYIWTFDGSIVGEYRSDRQIYSPFISSSGTILFSERASEPTFECRIIEMSVSSDTARCKTIAAGGLFINHPVRLEGVESGDIIFVAGDYKKSAVGNPVPVRRLYRYSSGRTISLGGSKFTTIGRLCQVNDTSLIGVTDRVLDERGLSSEEALRSDSDFRPPLGIVLVDIDNNEVKATAPPIDGSTLGKVLSVSCSQGGDFLFVESVSFPKSGGNEIKVSKFRISSWELLYEISLPREKIYGHPCMLGDGVNGSDVSLFCVEPNSDGRHPSQIQLALLRDDTFESRDLDDSVGAKVLEVVWIDEH
ncbi:MAG: hypothetical protein QNJ44_21960 [Rhodobacter sp.]|nr:hypothetical protein [Rhodobacter sp.]